MSSISHKDGFVFKKRHKTSKPTGAASFSPSTLLYIAVLGYTLYIYVLFVDNPQGGGAAFIL